MKKWSNIPLRTKYILATFSSFLLFGIMTVILIMQVIHNQNLSDKLEISSDNVQNADIMRAEVASLYIAISHYAGDPMPEYEKDYEEKKTSLAKLVETASARMPHVDWALFNENLKGIQNTYETSLKKSVLNKENVAKRRQLQSINDKYTVLTLMLDETRQLESDNRQVIIDDMNKSQQNTIIVVVASFLIAGILSIALILITNRQIKQQLESVASSAKEISRGNLLQQPISITTKDEIGEVSIAMNDMKKNLTDMVNTIQQTAGKLNEDSRLLKKYSNETVTGTNIVQGEIHKTSENMLAQKEASMGIRTFLEEFSITFGEMTEKATSLNNQATIAVGLADESAEAMRIAAQEATHLRSLFKEADKERLLLQERTVEIDRMTTIVQNISKQTNLLALNASIEAARSGIHGKGFAVVAEEVKKLAGEVSQTAQTIREISNSITFQGNDMEKVFTEGLETSKHNVATFQLLHEKMDKILLFINESKNQNDHMAGSMTTIEEEKRTSDHLIFALTESIEENTAHMEETVNYLQGNVKTIESLSELINEFSEQADILQQSTSRFTV